MSTRTHERGGWGGIFSAAWRRQVGGPYGNANSGPCVDAPKRARTPGVDRGYTRQESPPGELPVPSSCLLAALNLASTLLYVVFSTCALRGFSGPVTATRHPPLINEPHGTARSRHVVVAL